MEINNSPGILQIHYKDLFVPLLRIYSLLVKVRGVDKKKRFICLMLKIRLHRFHYIIRYDSSRNSGKKRHSHRLSFRSPALL